MRTLHHQDKENKILLYEDQEKLNGIFKNIQAATGKGFCDKERYGKVGTIWEVIIIPKHISRQVDLLNQQAIEVMYKIKSRSISETALINTEVHTSRYMIHKIDHYQRRKV